MVGRNFLAVQAEHERLTILRVLMEAPSETANESVLQSALDMYGHSLSRDRVSTHTDWLSEQGLVTIEVLSDSLRVVTLTGRGEDVATGRSKQTGVQKPRRN